MLDFAQANALWDEAYEAASALGDSRAAADVAGDAAPDLLAEGRTETLHRWLEQCGPTLTEQPRAMLAHSELMI